MLTATTIEPGSAALRLEVSGMVQGVGFRPRVFLLAGRFGLKGWVRNTECGVEIHVEGAPGMPSLFASTLLADLPEHACITAVERTVCEPEGFDDFRILESTVSSAGVPMMLPDLAPCPACLAEMRDPACRRYHYPFTNCTHCGPRYSIIEAMPYDRARTGMKGFPMCPECLKEYGDAEDRRFHAQPIACPACGPLVRLLAQDGSELLAGGFADDVMAGVTQALKDGLIVALMGVGGFQLLTDAASEKAVARLRRLKGRDARPFAVMVPDMAGAEALCLLSDEERALLSSPAAPIVLARRREGCSLAPAVCTFSRDAGVMLPSSPLHALLMDCWKAPLVATSGNMSGEPLCVTVKEALDKLGSVADLFCVHDRPIVRPVDDSVVRVTGGGMMMLRRARGYAPSPVWRTHDPVPDVLALGSGLKNSICWLKNGVAVMSQHLGDLENAFALHSLEQTVAAMGQALHAVSHVIAVDAHPDGPTAALGRRLSGRWGVPVVAVQHHEAHVRACAAETGAAMPALGVAWDGTGFGPDGTIWGGEFLLMDERGEVTRAARLRPFLLPGGDEAVREPARCACSLARQMAPWNAAGLEKRLACGLDRDRRTVLEAVMTQGINCPVTSSMGRLFDAMAFWCGFDGVCGCEGHAAIMLEAWAAEAGVHREDDCYEWVMHEEDGLLELDWRPLMKAVNDDLEHGVPRGVMARRFHDSLANLALDVAERFGLDRLVLGGGCFQNAFLLEGLVRISQSRGCSLFLPQRAPCHDGGVSLGQAVAAARQWKG